MPPTFNLNRLRVSSVRRHLANWSLRAKVTLGVIVPMIAVLSLFTFLQYRRHRAYLLSNLSVFASYSAEVVETNLRHQMLEADLSGVETLVHTVGAREEFEALYILDTQGEVRYAPHDDVLGNVLDNRDVNCQPCHALPAAERPESVVVEIADGQRVFRSMFPLENGPECAECHGTEERLLGLLLTDISMAPIEEPLAADLRENLLWWGAAILVTVLIVNTVVDRGVLHRLEELAGRMSGFGAGEMLTPSHPAAGDEIGQLSQAFETMAQRIERRRVENQVLSERLRRQHAQRGKLLQRLITAQEDERKRIARELHDDLGQTLGGLALRVEVTRRLVDREPERALQQLGEIDGLIARSTAGMYDIILDLRPSALDDLGLVPALRSYADRLFEESGVACELRADEFHDRLPAEIETALFRMFQEALNNVKRHASAQNVTVSLHRVNGTFEGTVVDDGQGFDLASVRLKGNDPRGLGLLGMQERITFCGGHIDIQTAPGAGTTVRVQIPISEVKRA